MITTKMIFPTWLRPDDRLLITGGTGWFGRTLVALATGHPHVLVIGSPRDSTATQWDDESVRDFAPTVVANFAFHTRDRLPEMGRERFIAENTELTRRLLVTLGLDSVRLALTVSSGAAASPNARAGADSMELYGALKAAEEAQALSLSTSERRVVVARAYSVSGPFVRRVRDYAFSDFVAQAILGDLTITASRPVFRRYVSVADLISVSLSSADQGWSGVIESGGDLVEMQGLAEVVRDVVNPSARIHREALMTEKPSVYASDNTSWEQACLRTGIVPMSLRHQVRSVEDFVRSQPGFQHVDGDSESGGNL